MRDSYRKSLCRSKASMKSGSGASKAKAYVYSSQLRFLDKIFEERDTQDTLPENKDDDADDDEDVTVENEQDPVEPAPSVSSDAAAAKKTESYFKKPAPRKRKIDSVELEMIAALKETPNRHLSFFKGLLPSLEDFDEFDTLDFQMEVLKVVKNIRQRKHPITSAVNTVSHPFHNQHQHPQPQPRCTTTAPQQQSQPQISAGQYENSSHFFSTPGSSHSSPSISEDSSDYPFQHY